MESRNMKNIVVLKKLPSNIIDEAIIILKETSKVRQKELIDKGAKTNIDERQSKSKDYILKEAEMLVTDYINKIEKGKQLPALNLTKKYNILKKYSIISTSLLIISLIINFI